MRFTREQAEQSKVGQNPVNQKLIAEATQSKNVTPYRPHIQGESFIKPGKFPAACEVKKLEWNRQLGIRPSADVEKLNKTERRYLTWLEQQQNFWIGVQCITLKLGHDCRYSPDFAAFDSEGLRLIDVKAKWSNGTVHIEDDAQVKLSVAARLFPMFHFVIAWPDGQVWNHRSYKP